ncbi:MAG TPA: hypothetical protein VK990_01440 [Acidimicrobiia bacterium]|nr:hypothetical protein [Acidimicrobiia bacterium]
MRLQEQRRVGRPRNEVFRYTADFANIEDWDPGQRGKRPHLAEEVEPQEDDEPRRHGRSR